MQKNPGLTKNETCNEKNCLREFVTKLDTNQPAKLQKLARVLKFWIQQV